MSERTSQQKAEIRAAVRASRRARSAEERSSDRTGLQEQLGTLVRATGARTVTAYAPLADEPDVSGFLAWARRRGVRVLLPVSLPGHRIAWAVDRGEHGAGKHGIAEPRGARLDAAEAASADLLIVPACAVDLAGTRLGWGLGYYDRMLGGLTRVPPVYAVVNDEDVFPALPRDAHDVPVTGAITPTRTLRFASSDPATAH